MDRSASVYLDKFYETLRWSMKTWNRQHELVGHKVLILGHGFGWVVGVSNKEPLRIRALVNSRPVNTKNWGLIQ